MNWVISEEDGKLVGQRNPLCSLMNCGASAGRSLGLKEGSTLDLFVFFFNNRGVDTKHVLIQLVHDTTSEKVFITTAARLMPP